MGENIKGNLRRYAHRYSPLLVDMSLAILSMFLAFQIRFEGRVPQFWQINMLQPLLVTALVRGTVNYFFNFYRQLWAYASRRELLLICKATATGSVVLSSLVFLGVLPNLPRSVLLLDCLLYTAFVGYYRLLYSSAFSSSAQAHSGPAKRVLIVGAGECGAMLMREFQSHPEFKVVAFCDDDPLKRHQRIFGVRVEGYCEDIPKIAQKFAVDQIIIAIPSAPAHRVLEIVTLAKKTGKKVRIVPALYQLANKGVSIRQLRDVKPEELLGRSVVKYQEPELIGGYLAGRVVLVTGAGGSIGSELCRQIVQFQPKELILLGRGENSIYEIENELRDLAPDLKLHTVIADIRQKEKIELVFEQYKPQIVYHAAAHKHVPLMEENPDEAITNNVMGTLNLAQAADRNLTERFILISTDKAVNPTSVMGATKRLAEVVIQHVSQNSKTRFMAVRFGNVLGSRGSVVPLFCKQIETGGPVTVTDPRMTRYFMTIPEAVMLVLHAGAMGTGGEVFILDMGEPMRVEDLACQLIRAMGYEPGKEIPICYTGIRPGEKLYEELCFDAETMTRTSHPRIWALLDTEHNYDCCKAQLEALIRQARELEGPDVLREKLFKLVALVDAAPKELYQKHVDEIAAAK